MILRWLRTSDHGEEMTRTSETCMVSSIMQKCKSVVAIKDRCWLRSIYWTGKWDNASQISIKTNKTGIIIMHVSILDTIFLVIPKPHKFRLSTLIKRYNNMSPLHELLYNQWWLVCSGEYPTWCLIPALFCLPVLGAKYKTYLHSVQYHHLYRTNNIYSN